LSADGNTLAVGAYGEASNAIGINCNGDNIDTNGNGIPDCQEDNSLIASGAVYIYTQSNNTWTQQAYVKASNTGDSDGFGRTVTLSADGNTLAVGAVYEDSNALGVNCIGNSVDADSNGIPDCQEDNSIPNVGALYIFTRNSNTWTQNAYVKASNTGGWNENFGGSVSLSADGNTLAVGVAYEDSDATGIGGNPANDCGTTSPSNCATDSGAVYLY
jgi:hypothetical protein